MDLTEIRKQIFPRYIGQKLKASQVYENFTCDLVFWNSTNTMVNGMSVLTAIEYNAILQLKLLSSITDEERIQVAKFEYSHRKFSIKILESFEHYFNVDFKRESGSTALFDQKVWFHDNPNKVDYLRSLGFATDQTILMDGKPVTLSIEKQIELNIIELIK